MTTISTLADKYGETRRRLADLETHAEQLRQKLIALGQSTVAGERFIASIRTATMYDLNPDALRKRMSEDQLQRCLVPVEHVIVTVHERGSDE